METIPINRKQISNYFDKFPHWTLVVIIVGLCMMLAKGFALVIGLLAIAGAIWFIVSFYKGKPTDQQMDEWLTDDFKALESKGLNKMGIDSSDCVGESVLVHGPRTGDTGGAKIRFKKGKDGVVRYTPINTTIISFTQNQLLVYTCSLDFLTGNALSESTDEYFYKDVVSVSTKTESKTVEFNKSTIQLNAAETFALTTSGGTSVSVLLRDPKLIEAMGGGSIPVTDAEKAIQVVRKMLREKKVA